MQGIFFEVKALPHAKRMSMEAISSCILKRCWAFTKLGQIKSIATNAYETISQLLCKDTMILVTHSLNSDLCTLQDSCFQAQRLTRPLV